MAYLYIHTCVDTGNVFYVGIGSNNNDQFNRAFSKKRRSKLWKNVTASLEYKVDILFKNISWGEACEKEKELIKFYGRKIDSSGVLLNVTLGGEGAYGFKHSKDHIKKLSETNKLGNNPNAKRCIHFETDKIFNSLKEACVELNLSYGQQTSAIRRKQSTAKFYFENDYFERPTKEDISKKLGILRIGNTNSKRKLN